MNCWFCDSPIDESTPYILSVKCRTPKCHQYNVLYKFVNDCLVVVQLRTQLNNHKYIVNYWADCNYKIVVVEQLPAPFNNGIEDSYNYEKVLDIPCDHRPINPDNVNDKLSLLLLLS